jgi:Flp pilus assembly protein TadB
VNPYLVLGVTSGAVAAGGLVWLVRAFTTPAQPARTATWMSALAARAWSGGRRSPAEQRRYRLMAAGAVAVAVVTWLVSGLPVLGLVAAAAVPGLPWLLAAGAAERRAIAQLEAVAEWTRRLRDVSDVGTGLQSAIITAAATAPAAIAGPVRMLAARLEAGAEARTALRRFADEIDDGTCDQVVATLLLHLSDRGEKLGVVLAAIARAASTEVAMRKEADAERASARFSIRFMAGFAVLVVAAATVAGDYMAPYATGVGQVVMTTLVAGFIATLWWVRSLTRPVPAPRMLGPAARSAP